MRRILRWSVMAGLGLTLSACATMNVSSHVEGGLDFSQYHTWRRLYASVGGEGEAAAPV